MLNLSLSLSVSTFYLKISEACQSATPVHCEWNGWDVGQCSVSCGYGTRHNTRTKRVHEKNGGSCSGSSSETVSCFERECPGMHIRNILHSLQIYRSFQYFGNFKHDFFLSSLWMGRLGNWRVRQRMWRRYENKHQNRKTRSTTRRRRMSWTSIDWRKLQCSRMPR